ncbi:MAG: type VI secretion system protein TssA [Deltaproteobacteria bacterium]|nr:type VI secretion system protein TssA [Deltaproteobacteria bacterium]
MSNEKEITPSESEETLSSVSEEISPPLTGEAQEADTAPFYLNLQKLLAPIPGENPAGESLRYEGTYDRIKEAREEEADLPQGIWEREVKRADWKSVQDLCIGALENRSKDLQIAVWLLESMIHQYGFSGVREGLHFLKALCEAFWDDLYPEIEEDDFESRISPIVFMNEKFGLPLKMVQITRPTSLDAVPYTGADWENALYLENRAQRDKEILQDAETKGKVTRAKFLGSVMFTATSFYEMLSDSLQSSIELAGELGHFFDEKCGKQAPSLKQFTNALEDIQLVVNSFLKEKKESDVEPELERDRGGVPDGQVNMEGEGERSHSRFVRSRAEAYRMLTEAADYLLIHEPHSPTPYLVKRAVSWGNMTLSEILQELVSDEHDLQQIYKLLGIRHIPQVL